MTKTLVISDTHFDKRVNEKKINKIIQLIKENDKIIILGDFWDKLHIKPEEFLALKVMQPLFNALKEKHSLYLYGNHDPIIEKDYSKFYIFCDEIKYEHVQKSGSNIYHFVHGDLFIDKNKFVLVRLFDYLVANWIGESRFSRFGNFGAAIITKFTNGRNPIGGMWNKKILKQARLDEKLKGKILICGHTHFQHDFKSYVNIGANLYDYIQYMIINDEGYFLRNEKLK